MAQEPKGPTDGSKDPHTRTYLKEKKFRAPPDEIERSELAAEAEGESWNDFARTALAERAEAVMRKVRIKKGRG